MNSKQIVTLLCTLSLCFYACTLDNSIAGGGTDVANGIVTGTIYNPDGTPGANVQVHLIHNDYNAYLNYPIPDSLIDTTDIRGVFRISIRDKNIYNIQAVHLTNRTRLLYTGIIIDTQTDTVIVSDTLKAPGALQVILPDTVDTTNGYLFVHGSFIAKGFLHSITVGSDNKPRISIDSIPESSSPLKLYYGLKSTNITKLIADSIVINPYQTTIINVSQQGIKPLWRFPLVIGMTTKTIQHYSGIEAIKKSIMEQINSVTGSFNDPGVFKGLFYFSPDSFYEISGVVDNENIPPPPGFAFRMIYDGFHESNLGNWRKGTRIIIHTYSVDNPNGMFGKEATEDLTWIFGLSRGCVIFKYLRIEADSNHINHEPYSGPASIMNDPHTYTQWDEYSINLVNHYAGVDSIFPEIIFSAYPQSLGLRARSSAGNLLPDVKFTVYGIIPKEQKTTDTALISGTTGQNGEFVLTDNPFLNTAESKIAYFNFLVQAVFNTDTSFAWLPINDVSNAWFKNPAASFRLEFTF